MHEGNAYRRVVRRRVPPGCRLKTNWLCSLVHACAEGIQLFYSLNFLPQFLLLPSTVKKPGWQHVPPDAELNDKGSRPDACSHPALHKVAFSCCSRG